MKTNIIGTVLAAALIALFSTAGFTMKSTQIPGESHRILPVENSEITEFVIYQSCETDDVEAIISGTTEPVADVITKESEVKNMDDMLLMFWHGVAAVIIGEMLALIAAVAWAIIKGKR